MTICWERNSRIRTAMKKAKKHTDLLKEYLQGKRPQENVVNSAVLHAAAASEYVYHL